MIKSIVFDWGGVLIDRPTPGLLNYFSKYFKKDYLLDNLSLYDLCCVLSKTALFIGPSTGPMHIAAAMGTKVFAIFSPIKVQSAARWAPWGNCTRVITPEVNCKKVFGQEELE